MIADILLNIRDLVAPDLRPTVDPLLSSIMRFEQEADRLRALEASIIKSESDARLRIVTDELEAIGIEIERLEIQTALRRLCHEHGFDPELIERVAPHCRFDDSGLTILDRHGVPISFNDAVLEFR